MDQSLFSQSLYDILKCQFHRYNEYWRDLEMSTSSIPKFLYIRRDDLEGAYIYTWLFEITSVLPTVKSWPNK